MLYPVKVKLEDERCKPYKKHKTDAGWDLRSNNETFTLYRDAKVIVHTGVELAIPKGQVGMIVPRSGLGTKYRVELANTVGIIDSYYRGEILVTITNNGLEDIIIEKYDRFCQILFLPVNISDIRIVSVLPSSPRGDSGFGHSGVK